MTQKNVLNRSIAIDISLSLVQMPGAAGGEGVGWLPLKLTDT